MVWWETREKEKKSSCSAEKNRNTQVEQIHPHAPLLSFFGKRKIAERAFTLILLGVCEIRGEKKKKKKNKEMRERDYIWNNEKSLELCLTTLSPCRGMRRADDE